MTDDTSDPIVTDDMRACREFALSLPAGRPFSEFGGGVAHRLHALKAERDHLRKTLTLLDRITAGDDEPTGNEPEDICQIVERFVMLRRQRDEFRWRAETESRISAERQADKVTAVLKLDRMQTGRDELQARNAVLEALVAREGSEAWRLIEELAQDELESVEIIHPNPDFGGPGFKIIYFWGVGDGESQEFFGGSYLECLQAASLFRKERKEL